MLSKLETGHWVSLATAALAASIVATGWWVTSCFTSQQDMRNTQRAQKLSYLIEAYDQLALASNRAPNEEYARMIETAVARIQLFGTPDEINAVHKALDDWSKPEPDGRPRASLDPVLFLLRNSLREELALPPVASNIRWIRPLGGAQ